MEKGIGDCNKMISGFFLTAICSKYILFNLCILRLFRFSFPNMSMIERSKSKVESVIIVALITSLISVLSILVTHFLERRRSKSQQRREDKCEKYKQLIAALFSNNKENKAELENLTNYFVLVASTEAVDAYYDFFKILEDKPDISRDDFDVELTKCVNAIRVDYHENKKYGKVKKVYRVSLK